MTVRLEPGAISEVVDVAGVGPVAVRYERCPAGWQASFSVTLPDAPDRLGEVVTHRLVGATMSETRRAVPEAVAFLLGRPTAAPPATP